MVQIGIRIDDSLHRRLKLDAKRAHRSLNAHVTTLLEESTKVKIPRLRLEDFQLSEETLELGKTIPAIPEELIKTDDRLAYLLSK